MGALAETPLGSGALTFCHDCAPSNVVPSVKEIIRLTRKLTLIWFSSSPAALNRGHARAHTQSHQCAWFRSAGRVAQLAGTSLSAACPASGKFLTIDHAIAAHSNPQSCMARAVACW